MIKRPEEIALMAESGRLLAGVFAHLDSLNLLGMSTMKVNATFTIEPMLNQERHAVRTEDDGWTVVTCDGQLSAQFEHPVAVTRQGVRVLTLRPGEAAPAC